MHYLLLILACLAGCRGLAVRRQETIQAPNFLVLTHSSTGFTMSWNTVKSADEGDRVIGYKVKFWQLPTEVYELDHEAGLKTSMKELFPAEINDEQTPSDAYAQEFVVPGALAHNLTIVLPSIRTDVVYGIAVRAFSKTHDGPLSARQFVQLQDVMPELGNDEEYNIV